MSHLTPESLARLVDESPTPGEGAHLAACRKCRESIAELRAQTIALRALPPAAPPADAWEKITARLDADRIAPLHSGRITTIATRAAAAAIVFALGAASGAAFTRRGDAPQPAPSSEVVSAGEGRVAPISGAVSPDLALTRLRITEMLYTSALLDYAAATSPQPPRDAVARLATLETIVLTTRTALERAPTDPLINSYHLAALAERQTLLGQLRHTPESKQWY